MKFLFLAFVILSIVEYCFGQDLTRPELTPSRTNQEERAIIDEGIALQDQGKHEEAIKKYKQVLEKNPNNIVALYEIAHSYFSAEKCDDSLKASYQGARYKSDYLSQFYLMIGNCLNKLAKTSDAISAFKQALEILPDNALIRFNLAAALINAGKLDDARPHLKTAVQLDPKHASSHYALGQVFYQQEYRFPSALALLRFLTLEPATKRSQKALSMLDENFRSGVESKDATMQANARKDEGDFQAYDLMMSIPNGPKSTSMKMMIESLDGLVSLMAKTMENEKGKFVVDYYFPYFIELKKNGLIVPFSHYIFQSSDAEAAQWVNQHPEDVDRFLKWSSTFSLEYLRR